MRLHLFLLGLLVAAGLIGSVLLVPGAKELAYMHFKAQNFDLARRDFERMIEKGDVSASVVLPLGELYLIQGEMERAIKLVESYVGANSWDIAGFRKLADFYKFGQRTAMQIATLEAMNERHASRDSLRELMGLLDVQGRVDDHTRVLKALVELGVGDADDYELLAFRSAAAGRGAEAQAVLTAFRRRYPKAFLDHVAELELSLALDRGDVAGGFETARRWVIEHADASGAISLAQVLAARGRSDLGLRVLEPVVKEPIQDAQLLGTVIDLEFAAGRSEQARRRVLAWGASGHLPESRLPSLIDVTLATQGVLAAMALVDRTDAELLPEWLTIGLVEAAVRDGQADIASRLVGRLGIGFLEARPTLAAELAWLRKDRRDFERWIGAALARTDLPLDDKASLARLLIADKRIDVALRLMRDLVMEPATPVALAADLAQLYVTSGRQAEGLALFERLRTERPSPVILEGWARLAALRGHGEAVATWLADAVDPGVQLLEDLFFIAGDTRQHPLALVAARRLYGMRPTREVAMYLAEALIQNGRPKEALAPLRSLLPGDQALRATYVAALEAAGEIEELTRFRSTELEQLAGDDPRRGEVARLLMDLGAYDRALPTLRVLAAENGGEWIQAYAEAAKKAKRIEEGAQHLRSVLGQARLARTDEETTLHALVDLIGPDAALDELRAAADKLGGDWVHAYVDAASKGGRSAEANDRLVAWLGRPGQSLAATEALLSLLAERAPERALGFLDEAARRAPDRWADRLIDQLDALDRRGELVTALRRELDRPGQPKAKQEARLYLLIDRGGEAEALPYLAKIARGDGGDWVFAYDKALTKLGRVAERDAYLASIATDARRNPVERRQVAFRLLEIGRRAEAVQAFRLLADRAEARSADIDQLLHFWGPRPGADEIAWIEARARGAVSGDRGLWLRRLLAAGAIDRAVGVAERFDEIDDAAFAAYVEALAQARDRAAIGRAVERASAVPGETKRLLRLAKLAEQTSQTKPAALGYAAVLKREPDNAPALLGAGRIAYAEGRRAEAKAQFLRLVALGQDDYEASYLLGDIQFGEKKVAEAREAWGRALARLEDARVRTYAMRVTEALTLHRLGRSDEAVAAFKALREERPKDANLLGDYANVLLDLGRRDEAAALLAGH
jgi:tetratricopeptide (TPR) repeat protein